MTDSPQIYSGIALLGPELAPTPADIIVENGKITGIEERTAAPRDPDWIVPALFNAHTHLGDTIAMDCGATGNLVELVTPPDGLKHRLLRAASREDLVAGMRASVGGMIAAGTAGCADFREGGPDGVAALKEACDGLPFRAVILGREGGEEIADGAGISSARDITGLERIVSEVRRAGRKVAFHAGERDAEDVDDALAFDPDFIVHATHATPRQLRHCADAGIPIVVCPRSNWLLGVTSSARRPPVLPMQKLGCTVWLGTDNAMFVPPDLFSEMAFLSTVTRVAPPAILRMAVGGSALGGTPFYLRRGAPANFFTVRTEGSSLRFSRDPVATITKRASFAAIGTSVFNSENQ